MKLIRDLVKNHHDYVQDSQGIARSEILLVLDIYDIIKMNLSLKVARERIIQLQINARKPILNCYSLQ